MCGCVEIIACNIRIRKKGNLGTGDIERAPGADIEDPQASKPSVELQVSSDGKRNRVFAIAAILVVLGAFFSYFGYIAYNEKAAMDDLSYTITSASVSNWGPAIQIGDIGVSIDVSMRFSNPTGCDTPIFSTDFNWYISSSTFIGDGQYCGTGNLDSVKVLASSSRDSTFSLTFYLGNVSPNLLNAIQSGQFYLILSGTGNAKIFFDLISVTKTFTQTKSVSYIAS
jgi:hypothetical protein